MKLTLDIFDETRSIPEATLGWLLSHAQRACRRLDCTGGVRVRVVADLAMAAAHEEFAGVSGTTDVLTFDMSDPEEVTHPPRPEIAAITNGEVIGPYALDADLMICLDEATRQSSAGGYPFERELLLYIIHGILHCIGFDDHDEAEFAAMHAVEDAVLASVGVGAVFHRPPSVN